MSLLRKEEAGVESDARSKTLKGKSEVLHGYKLGAGQDVREREVEGRLVQAEGPVVL